MCCSRRCSRRSVAVTVKSPFWAAEKRTRPRCFQWAAARKPEKTNPEDLALAGQLAVAFEDDQSQRRLDDRVGGKDVRRFIRQLGSCRDQAKKDFSTTDEKTKVMWAQLKVVLADGVTRQRRLVVPLRRPALLREQRHNRLLRPNSSVRAFCTRGTRAMPPTTITASTECGSTPASDSALGTVEWFARRGLRSSSSNLARLMTR